MSVSLVMGTVLPNVPSGFFSEILASMRGAARRPEKTTVPSMADSGKFIRGGATTALALGHGRWWRSYGARRRGRRRGRGTGAAEPPRRLVAKAERGGGAGTGRGEGDGGAVPRPAAAAGWWRNRDWGAGALPVEACHSIRRIYFPAGNDLWHFGQITWGTAGRTGPRRLDAGGSCGRWGSPCCGFPQRAHVAADAGFMLPQDAQRM